ncbi:hypothetical protein RvY_01542 [Ramazzottius varieornatus]|uniref:Uncharacterized protein n=1 Tax=Ramazzottius varieornatus TaxID=947166 RepID=A0A1D1UGN5_RAMVA|nr:hypothetical protein RvY_01542 [Ramazzottius varieornatus]
MEPCCVRLVLTPIAELDSSSERAETLVANRLAGMLLYTHLQSGLSKRLIRSTDESLSRERLTSISYHLPSCFVEETVNFPN